MEATVSPPWKVETSKASMRCGGSGRPSARWSSSSTACVRLPRERRWLWSASAAFSSAIATSSRFLPRWGAGSSTRPPRRPVSHSPVSSASGTSTETRISGGGTTSRA